MHRSAAAFCAVQKVSDLFCVEYLVLERYLLTCTISLRNYFLRFNSCVKSWRPRLVVIPPLKTHGPQLTDLLKRAAPWYALDVSDSSSKH